MEYTISQLSKLAGVSSRTLRYYEEIGLLMPCGKTEGGYRLYSEKEIDLLHRIMYYRSFGIELGDIKQIIYSPDYNPISAFEEHLEKLQKEKEKITRLINNVNKTLYMLKGECEMSNNEKFSAFKQNLVAENEKKYGAEIRAKYGDKTIDESNRKLLRMTEQDWANVEELTEALNTVLKAATEQGDPESELAQKACEMHKKWLGYYWNFYSKEAHLGLCLMYTQDERFKEYYEKIAPGCADFLYEAMKIYLA